VIAKFEKEKLFFLIFILFICAYNVWVISPPFPHPLPCPSLPGRNYSAQKEKPLKNIFISI
jgi:hypothetical protein